ncbi:MAG: hypothetical protein ACYC0T_05960 [Ramlibacter sp.]
MSTWKQALREGAVSGAAASVLSAAVLLLAGARQNRAPAAPVNAVSHWIWDRPALAEDGPSARHTLAGYLIHHAASVWWATLHAKAWGTRERAKRPGPALAGAAAAAAVACLVDLKLTPRRLTPGFEHRLSAGALLGVYACFAVGLALGSMAVAAAEDEGRGAR